ncbi:MAG: hypothetical protein ABEK59_11770 [Halobacteria archaeon]
MSDIKVDYADTVYCSVADVEGLFRKDTAFARDSNPTDNEVLQLIRSNSDKIDRYTRHAWRANTVNEEYKDYDTTYRWDAGRPVQLNKMHIRSLNKLEIWDGSQWDDWVAGNEKEGRDEDYWLDERMGQLFIYDRFVWRARPQLRVTYTYGDDTATSSKTLDDGTSYTVIDGPHDIKEACYKLTAADLILSDQHTNLVPGGDGAPSPERAAESWRNDVYGNDMIPGMLERHKIDPAWVEPYG